MWSAFRTVLSCGAAALVVAGFAAVANADGHIMAETVVSAPQGTYNGTAYTRYEAMFEGSTSNGRPYRVPCQIITPTNPLAGSRLLLFDLLVPSTVHIAVGQEQADARYTMTDQFLFGRGISYATVRCEKEAIGTSSPFPDSTRPWSDNLLDTSSEFITSAADTFDIVTDFNWALRSDPIALQALGRINRRAAFSYSAGGTLLRGLLRIPQGRGLFDFSLVGGTSIGFSHPAGNDIGFSNAEKPPAAGAGLEIDFQSETDVLWSAGKTRHQEPNYRCYQLAGCAHIRNIDCVEFGLADPAGANPAEWTPFIRALFVAANNWCDGIAPPPTIWLGAPNDPSIARDANGNALVRVVGGLPYIGTGYRLPEVAVGQNQYISYAPAFDDGTFPGLFRSIGGSHVDLTGNFTNHAAYVAAVTSHARALQAQGYLLQPDADAIILRAIASDIGH